MKKESKSIYLPILLILFSIFVSGKKLAVLPGLVNPFEFIIDADRIYIPDEATIFIYSLKDYSFIKKFGKEGEGPQEFFLNRAGGNNQVAIFFKDNQLLVYSFGRMSYFTKDGEYVKEIKIPGTVGRWFGALKDKFIGRKFSRDKNHVKYHHILMYDSNFKLIKEIYRHEHPLNLRLNKKFNPLTIDQADFKICDNKIFVIDSQRTRIIIYNEKGEKIVTIIPGVKRVEFTKEDKENLVDDFKFSGMWTRLYTARKSLFVFPDFYPPIRRFYLDAGDKRIYVQSYYSTSGDDIEFLIFDFNGKLIERVMMPFKIESRSKFYNGKIYQVMENEEIEEYELHVLEIN
jgi:hypothetical protein